MLAGAARADVEALARRRRCRSCTLGDGLAYRVYSWRRGGTLYRRRGPRRLRQRAPPRPPHPRRGPAGPGQCRGRASPRPAIPPPSPAPRPGRSIRPGRATRPIAATMPALMPRRPNSSPVLSTAEQRRGGPGRGAGQRRHPAIQPRLLRRGRRSVRQAPRTRAAATWSSPGCFAIIAPSTCSTAAAPPPRWPSSTSRCRPRRPAGARPPRPRSTPAPPPGSTPNRRRLRQLGGAGGALLPEERAQILDAQAQHLRGTLLRLAGQPEPASAALQGALAQLASVRGRPGHLDRLDAGADSRRARRARRGAAATPPRPSASTRRRSPCSRPTIPARPPCSAPRPGSRLIMRAAAARPRRAPSTSGWSTPMPRAAARRRPCTGRSRPISPCSSARAATRRRSPRCSRRASSSSGPASPRPRRCWRAS